MKLSTMQRKKLQRTYYFRLIMMSLIIGMMAALLAFTLKWMTEHFQEVIFQFAEHHNHLLFILLPTVGITAIYFLRKYFFQNRRNKGITEIYKTLDQRKDHLPFFKIPSHYINGFLTVIFGGSTGIEVSTVVATATVGNIAYQKEFSAKMYKRELVCAGVCAGVAILFGSPVVGWLFAVEVIARKISKTIIMSCTASALVAWLFIYFLKPEPLISLALTDWKWTAVTFMIVLSILGSFLSIYFTLLVTRIKKFFSGINNNFVRVNLGALVVGSMIFIFPYLYGDSYHALKEFVLQPTSISLFVLIALVFLKPLASSLTLGAGGDGGVFAPSIVAGGFLGLTFAMLCNTYFGTSLNYLNFALIGASATLSASIYAPFTALFLVCNLVPNGFTLFFPLILSSFIANYFSKWIFPYNVYTYDLEVSKAKNH